MSRPRRRRLCCRLGHELAPVYREVSKSLWGSHDCVEFAYR
jgi:hypothetical protein